MKRIYVEKNLPLSWIESKRSMPALPFVSGGRAGTIQLVESSTESPCACSHISCNLLDPI